MKSKFRYQFEFTGLSILAMCFLGYGIFGQDIELILTGIGVCILDVGSSALNQYLRWRTS